MTGQPSPAAILRLALEHPPTLATGRLVCVDGPAGSGKTTLAAALAAGLDRLGQGPATVVHMDDLYPGWDGLDRIDPIVLDLLRPLSQGGPGRYRRYDWVAAAYAEEHVVEPGPLLVLEGVGSGGSAWADLVTSLVWVEAPAALRLERGLDRDGPAVREEWVRWMADESALFDRERTRERSDLRVDGTRPY